MIFDQRSENETTTEKPISRTRRALILIFVCVVVFFSTILERTIETVIDSMHREWLKEEIPYPVELEYHIVLSSAYMETVLYEHGFDRSSIFQRSLRSASEWAYKRAIKKIPEDDGFRLWFYFCRYYAAAIKQEDSWAEQHVEDLFSMVEKLLESESKVVRFEKDLRYLFIEWIFDYFTGRGYVLKEHNMLPRAVSLIEKSKASFLTVNKDGFRNNSSTRLFPFESSRLFFHYLILRDSSHYRSCSMLALHDFVVAYNNIRHAIREYAIDNITESEQKIIDDTLASNKRVRDAFASSTQKVCNINLDEMEKEDEARRGNSHH